MKALDPGINGNRASSQGKEIASRIKQARSSRDPESRSYLKQRCLLLLLLSGGLRISQVIILSIPDG
jgi:hypothetical protein